ncbi:MAG TPA: hypothetical protein VEC17_01075 [Candidatus Binatia bacterium]|nr:hypothetical protein [Candidatus Binatia bacterium]
MKMKVLVDDTLPSIVHGECFNRGDFVYPRELHTTERKMEKLRPDTDPCGTTVLEVEADLKVKNEVVNAFGQHSPELGPGTQAFDMAHAFRHGHHQILVVQTRDGKTTKASGVFFTKHPKFN